MPVMIASVSIVSEAGVVLVREAEDVVRGLWNLPGGRMEDGESLPEAALREAWEETGTHVRLLGLTGIYTYRVPSGRTLVNCNFRAELVGELPEGFSNEEIMETRLVPWEELENWPDEHLFRERVTLKILMDAKAGHCHPLEWIKHFE